jgi:hypothetical protein
MRSIWPVGDFHDQTKMMSGQNTYEHSKNNHDFGADGNGNAMLQ